MLGFFIRIQLYFLAALPLSLVHALGAMIGGLFRFIPHNYSNSLNTNISLCLPELTGAERKRFIRQTYRELGKTLFETGAMLLWSPERLRKLIVEVHGVHLLDDAMAAGKGVIIGVPHLGCWEVLGMYLPTRCTLTSLYRPIPIAAIDRLVKRARKRAGSQLAPTENRGIRQLVSALKRNEAIVILPDQDPRLEGQVFAPLFGTLASTATLLPRLAAKNGAPVVFCVCERLPRAQGYRVRFIAGSSDIGNADIVAGASAMNRDIETCIRLIPHQYQWTYKRFKTRPPGEEAIYK